MSSTKLKFDIQELKSINNNLQQLSEQIRPLRQRKKQLEDSILQQMKHLSQDGSSVNTIKMQDVEIVTVDKKVREKMKKEEREENAMKLLQQSGVNIHAARKTLKDLQEVMKGEAKSQPAIKLMTPTQAMNYKVKKGSLK